MLLTGNLILILSLSMPHLLPVRKEKVQPDHRACDGVKAIGVYDNDASVLNAKARNDLAYTFSLAKEQS